MNFGNIAGSFVKGMKAADAEDRKRRIQQAEIDRVRREKIIAEEIEALKPKGMLTGNTGENLATGSVAADSPQAPMSVKLKNAKGNWKDNFYEKVVGVESRGGDYTAYNKKSGAYGAYQFIPSTAKWVAGELGIEGEAWKEPANQDKMMDWFTAHNKSGLEKRGIPVTEETMWWAHNQGLAGASALYKGGKVKQANLSANAGAGGAQAYKDHWSDTFSSSPIVEATVKNAELGLSQEEMDEMDRWQRMAGIMK